MIEKFLNPFIVSFAFSVALTVFFIWLSKKITWKRRKGKRHIYRRQVFRLGGAAVITSFIFAILFDPNLVISPQLWGIIFASLIILAVGIIDDIRELLWKTQLFFQIAVAMLVYIMGTEVTFITNPFGGELVFTEGGFAFVGIIVLVFWIVMLINAVNWLDGIDGLSGGVTFLAALTLFFLSLSPEVNQPPLAIMSMALAGSVLGFLIFNFYPAKIVAGTSGSMFMGFIIAVLAVFAGAKIATAMLVMALPIIDSGWVIIERIKNKRSIFKPDERHLHYKLMELGWSQKKITLFYYLVTFVIAVIALNTRALGKLITMVLTAIIAVFAIFIVNQRIEAIKKRGIRNIQ